MEKLFEAHLDLLRTCHREILKALDGLPSQALDWSPGPGTNSISVLIFHLTGSERYWIGDVAMRESSNRDRDAEFAVHGQDIDTLKQRLDDSLAYAGTVLARLTVNDLSQSRQAPSDGRTVTIAWVVLHALEHAAIHLGHIQLTRQLWEQSQTTD